jgi:AcrR family transcriptional regulator
MYMTRKAYRRGQSRETTFGLTGKVTGSTAGINLAAVYRHLRDREALSDAAAAQGFRDPTRAIGDSIELPRHLDEPLANPSFAGFALDALL